jgi:mannose-6-phosphate isomerase-like protein (cupin superfamily)
MTRVHAISDLRSSSEASLFEGERHGDGVELSFFVVAAPPGGGPDLHVHPYAEVFVVQEGQATFTSGGEELVITAGNVVVVPPETPHRFENTGDGMLRLLGIHPSSAVQQTWVED